MSGFLKQAFETAQQAAQQALETGKSLVSGDKPIAALYVEFESAETIDRMETAVAALGGRVFRVHDIAGAVVKIADPEKSEAIVAAVRAFKPTFEIS
jgi:hypothetical protein